jgi:hypothetical protein
MPAKKKTDSKYKPFIGRLFTIRKHQSIPGYVDTDDTNQKQSLNHDEIGDAALILDETNSRVKITTKDLPVWIPKFYLHDEIISEDFETNDQLCDIIYRLLQISTELKTTNCNKKFKAIEIETIANNLRQLLDKL